MLGSSLAPFKLETISLTEETDPFLLLKLVSFPFALSLQSKCAIGLAACRDLHLEVAADEELASHGCDWSLKENIERIEFDYGGKVEIDYVSTSKESLIDWGVEGEGKKYQAQSWSDKRWEGQR